MSSCLPAAPDAGNRLPTAPGWAGRLRRTRIAAACVLALLPGVALADPGTLIATFLTSVVGPGLASTIIGFVLNYGWIASIAAGVYGGMDARRRARNAASDARNAYNASLTDRNITALSADPPLRAVYGRCVVGGDIVAILTSDKQGVRDDGSTYTKPDGYKHLVIVVASREVQAINDVLIDGVAVGALDADGWATTGDAVRTRRYYREITLAAGASYTGAGPLANVTAWDAAGTTVQSESENYFNGRAVAYALSNANKTITNNSAFAAIFSLEVSETRGSVRISKFLGTPTQTTDPWLLANVGTGAGTTKWTAADRLQGLAGVVVTLDLEDGAFQGGPPAILVDVSGHKLYDPRTATTAYSTNPALVARDYLTSELGFNCQAADIDDAYIIAAANACDALVSIDASMQATYTCNGTVNSDAGREAVLDDLAECMAGQIVYGAAWQVIAGAWVPPVMDLTDDDLHGQVGVVQAGAGIDDVFNGLRVQHIPAGSAVPDEPVPYAVAAFVTADGAPLWADVQLPYTNSAQRCRNIARVLTERARASQVLRVPCKLRAWPLQVGDRVRLTSAEYGLTAATYRVTDWQFNLNTPVVLTLQADAASIYDQADAVTAAVTPSSSLPPPWVVPEITGLVASSGTAELLRRGDGSVQARIRVGWDRVVNPYINDGAGRIEVRWRRPQVAARNVWQSAQVTGGDTGTWLDGVAEGELVVITVVAVNSFGVAGGAAITSHTVIGKSAAASNVASLAGAASAGVLTWTWRDNTDLDHAYTEVRATDAGWGLGSPAPLWRGNTTSWQEPVAAAGAVTRYLRHVDTTGHPSAASATATVNVTSARLAVPPSAVTAAQNAADAANAAIAAIASDNVLSAGEKPAVILDYTRATDENAGLVAQAASLNVSSTAYATAYTALGTYLGGLTSPTAWNNTAGDTTIVGSTFRSTWASFYSARQALLNAVVAAAPAQLDFMAERLWNFNNSTEFWSSSGMSSVVANPSYVRTVSSGVDPYYVSPTLSINGAVFTKVRVRLRRMSGSAFALQCFYRTSGHGYVGTHYKELPALTVAAGVWAVIEFDMANLTAGGTDWVSNTITGIRLDLGEFSGDTYDLDWVAIGSTAPGSYGATFGVNISGQATTADIALNAVSDVASVQAATVSVFTTGATNVQVASLTYTAPVACDVLLTATGFVQQKCVLAQWETRADILDVASTTTYLTRIVCRNTSTSDPQANGSASMEVIFSMTAGQTKTFRFYLNSGGFSPTGPQAGCDATIYDPALTLKVRKR
jgi:hypothetical protein